ncbi:MAG: tetratricopeptide repeat protein [bacterium]
MRSKYFAAAVILAMGLASFGRTLNLGFIWDDHQMIEENPHIKTLSADNIAHWFKSDPFNQDLNYYRPLVSMSNAVDFSLWKLNPAGYHATTLFFHLANSMLLFFLALQLGFSRTAALTAAALFAASPVPVEQMIITAGRAELMSLTFALLSISMFLRGGAFRYGLSMVFFAASLLAKENGIVTPLLFSLCLLLRKEKLRKHAGVIPFLSLIPLYLFIRQAAVGPALPEAGTWAVLKLSALKIPKITAYYIFNSILPLDLHSHRLQPSFGWDAWIYGAVFVAASAAVIYRRDLIAFFCGGWYLLNLAPKIPLLATNDLMLDHWVYPSCFGLFLAAGYWGERYASGRPAGPVTHRRKFLTYQAVGRWRKTSALACAAAALAFYVFEANRNITMRGSDMKIYEHAARRTTSAPMRYNLAREYMLSGKPEKALAYFKLVSAKYPENEIYSNGLAMALAAAGKTKDAERILDDMLKGTHPLPQTFYNRAVLFEKSGRNDKAEAVLHKCAGLFPDYADAGLFLSRIFLEKNEKGKARKELEALLVTDPFNAEALVNLGTLEAESGNFARAGFLWKKAVAVQPGNTAALDNLKKLRTLGYY